MPLYRIDEKSVEARAVAAIRESIENTANRVVDKDGSQA
jgi:hypothetical protein